MGKDGRLRMTTFGMLSTARRAHGYRKRFDLASEQGAQGKARRLQLQVTRKRVARCYSSRTYSCSKAIIAKKL